MFVSHCLFCNDEKRKENLTGSCYMHLYVSVCVCERDRELVLEIFCCCKINNSVSKESMLSIFKKLLCNLSVRFAL